MSDTSTWRKLIEREMEDNEDSFDNLVDSVGSIEGWLDELFECGYGKVSGSAFTLWTERRVYFPVRFDGCEWCGSVPRNPCKDVTIHQGGG